MPKIVTRSLYLVRNVNLLGYWLLSIVDLADASRVILQQLDGNSDYVNFCYIDVSTKLCAVQYMI